MPHRAISSCFVKTRYSYELALFISHYLLIRKLILISQLFNNPFNQNIPRIIIYAFIDLHVFNSLVTDYIFNCFLDWYLKYDISYLLYKTWILLLVLDPWGYLILVHKLFLSIVDADDPKPIFVQQLQFLHYLHIHDSVYLSGVDRDVVDRVYVYFTLVKISLLRWYPPYVWWYW